jgi:hypothetical protein
MEKFFQNYPHSKAIIHSHLEGQYPYLLSETNGFQDLYTTFDFHYVDGIIPSKNDMIKEIKRYIEVFNKEEFILFAPNKEWENFLKEVFQSIHGVIDIRLEYAFNKDAFENQYRNQDFDDQVILEYQKDQQSTKEYPVALIKEEQDVISYCKGFMIGNSLVEIDVFTKETHRNKQLAKKTSSYLIKHLLENKQLPSWSCWKQKKASQHLAKSLCFENPIELPAYVYVRDFGEISI